MLNKISLKCREVLYIEERNNNEWREKKKCKRRKQTITDCWEMSQLNKTRAFKR